ncbi:hypothetical protein EV714DRAFT_222434, partial [Schizophyllum commune]
SEVIEHDDGVARMSDRHAGPVIRRARSARRLTFDRHHAASVAAPAFSHPPPTASFAKHVAQAKKRPPPRLSRCTRQR